MKKFHYLFLFFGLVFAVLILFISLQSANKSETVGNVNMVSSKFYVSKEILPDHSLYPLLMLVDRFRLELSSAEKRTYLLVSYGNRRLFYSKKLLEKGNRALAFTTLSKAVKYINQALHENIVLFEQIKGNKKQEEQILAFFVLENYEKHTKFIIENRDQFSNEEKVILEDLLRESSVLAERLRKLIE